MNVSIYKGILFDCDGTLVDSMPAHYEAWCEVLLRHGMALSEEEFYALGGVPAKQVIEKLAKEFEVQVDADQIAHEKEDYYLEHCVNKIRPIDVVVNIAKQYREMMPMAVVSGSMRSVVEKSLDLIEIRDWFKTLVCAEDVEKPKPAPDVFLEAADRLGVHPQTCIVFEDAEPGIEAAREAGMGIVDVRVLKKITEDFNKV